MQEHDRAFYIKRDHNISINRQSRCVRLKTKQNQFYFSFKKYKTLDQALSAARRFRDVLPSTHFRGDYDHDKCPPKGLSKVLGVAKYNQRGDFAGWVACWQQGLPPDRHQKKKKFSFVKYGNKALEEAKAYRKKMVLLNRISNSYE